MGAIKDEDVQNDLKKKSKKRKKRKSDSLEEEHGNIESGNDSRKKRLKISGKDTLEVVDDVESNLGALDGSKEEKKDTRKYKMKEEANNGKREKKKKKNKVGDERRASPAEDVACDGSKEEKNDTRKGRMKKEVDNSKRDKCKKKNKVRDDRKASQVESVSEKIQPMEDKKKKKKKKKKEKKNMLRDGSLDKELVNDSNAPSTSGGESSNDRGSKRKQRSNPVEPSDWSTPSKKLKKVRFSDQVEFLSLADNSRGTERLKDHSNDTKKGNGLRRVKRVSKEPNLTVKTPVASQKGNRPTVVRGKQFSPEEDEIVKSSVLSYIEEHQLSEKGLDMVLKCGLYPELRDCWREIGKALPSRPHMSIYNRAHVLFERNESNSWTPEEIELVKNLRKRYGSDWQALAEKLGKKRAHLKCPNIKRGQWSQDEYQTLFDLVNTDLKLKASKEKKSKNDNGILRDNISWETVSKRLSTRSNTLCCQKWYDQLTSPMVAEGIWADVDDYRLVIALEELDAACQEDVDWENLLEHRSGDVCRKRWNQMVRNIGEHGTKSFAEQVEILSRKYCPDARVA